MKNLVEDAVRELHDELLARHPEFCSCPRCRDDVLALVMNHTRPRYATSTRGFALASLDVRGDQTRAELLARVFEAMRVVAQSPRHTPSTGTPSVGE